MEVKDLSKKIIQFRDERNWGQFHNPKDLAVSINIEAAELLELFQWKNEKEAEEFLKDSKDREKLGQELADVLIYLFDLAEITGIDLEKAVLEKLEHNRKKYPVEKAKNSSKKYTEL